MTMFVGVAGCAAQERAWPRCKVQSGWNGWEYMVRRRCATLEEHQLENAV